MFSHEKGKEEESKESSIDYVPITMLAFAVISLLLCEDDAVSPILQTRKMALREGSIAS